MELYKFLLVFLKKPIGNLPGLFNTILFSLFVAFYTTRDFFTWETNYLLLVVYLGISYLLLQSFFWILFQKIFKLELSYYLSNVPVGLLFYGNYVFVLVFGKQLGIEGLVMMFRGWGAGELGNFSSVMGGLIFLFLLFLFFYQMSYQICKRIIPNMYFSLYGIFPILIPLVWIHNHFLVSVKHDITMEKWKHKIPWQSLTGFPEDKVSIRTGQSNLKSNGYQFYKNPPNNPDTIEWENSLILKEKISKILTQDLVIKNNYNILMINVEGFRYDMLDPQYTPNLYEFTKQYGIQLKKHYSTGNNTPSGLIGMFTGLSPYYFEPMRKNQVPNPPLEILKKLGYRQSIYYNSPKNYEYIYRDFLEKTEGKYIQIPGRVEDYAYREKQLLDSYIKELQEDKSTKPRFDYYLVNVTHFNYYYPPEFEVFKPAFTMDFEIISGKQEKFQAHKHAIMNRYLNSLVYFDYLIGNLLAQLIKMGRLNHTILIIAGDHGEEFWEYGSFGHTWGLNNKQIQTAAVLYFPGIQFSKLQYRYTSHSDFFPTIFDILGMNIDTRIFMTGKSLLRYQKERDYAVSSLGVLVSFTRNQYAIMGNGLKILFKNGKNLNEAITEIYTDEDVPLENPDPYKVIEVLERIPDSKHLKISSM